MSEEAPTPQGFYTEAVPAQWNRALRDQERAVEAAQRVLDGMRGVTATVRVIVQGDAGGTFHLNIRDGLMRAEEEAATPPFLTVLQDEPAFRRLAQEAGDSALALLGGLSGLAGDMKLTTARLALLSDLSGCLRFEVTGPRGFALVTHFGSEPMPEEPTTSITVTPEVYDDLRGGRLDPQKAFLSGALQVEGDMQLAMQLALAALSPD